jgi:phage gp46-like protein
MLQTDQRATLEELTKANYYPVYPYDLRGWWGDSIRDNPIGSKLWLNNRRKATDLVLTQHKRYAEEALQPLVDSGVAKEINVYAEWTRRGVMLMNIQVVRPDNSSTTETFTFIWEEVQNGL